VSVPIRFRYVLFLRFHPAPGLLIPTELLIVCGRRMVYTVVGNEMKIIRHGQ
jgi:hypothetical protein